MPEAASLLRGDSMSVFTLRRGGAPSYGPPVGTTWLFEEDGEWECPADGQYQIEMHGGGGGGANMIWGPESRPYAGAAGGGGSGEIYTKSYTAGTICAVKIGAGGAYRVDADSSGSALGGTGGTTTFGDISIAGGGGGYLDMSTGNGGRASGSLASAGGLQASVASTVGTVAGGEGNTKNTAQTYGDGGSATRSRANAGKPGAVIITYLGA